MKIIGIDPSLANTAWCLLERINNRYTYVDHGMAHHRIPGHKYWRAKTDQVIDELAVQFAYQFKLDYPEIMAIEEPAFGSHGEGGESRSVAVAAVVRLAWKIAWQFRDKTEIVMLTPDSHKKSQRKTLLNCIHNFPRTNEHVRDAAVIALRA